MKIIYYSSHPGLSLDSPAGYATHMREMILAFENLGIDVHPVIMGQMDASNFNEDRFGNKIKNKIRSITPKYLWSSLKDYSLIKKDREYEKILLDAVNRVKPDLIYERASYCQNSGLKVASLTETPHMMEVNSPLLEERYSLGGDSWFNNRATAIENEQIIKTDLPIVVSRSLKEFYQFKYNVTNKTFLITHNAINPDNVIINYDLKSSILRDYNLNNYLVIGFVGSFFKWHGLDILIRSFKQLRIDHENIKLLIVGDGAIKESLIDLVYELDLQKEVIFTGSVKHEDVYSFIDCMDITILPNSHWYGSPVKLFEYGALGKAIIAPITEPVQDLMIDKVDGLLTQATPTKLKYSLHKLINDEELRKKLGSNFQNKIYNNYTWKKNAEKVVSMYNNMHHSKKHDSV